MTTDLLLKPSVLIVDDETGILETLRILLKNEGFATHVALGGKQGLEQLENVTPTSCSPTCACRMWVAWRFWLPRAARIPTCP